MRIEAGWWTTTAIADGDGDGDDDIDAQFNYARPRGLLTPSSPPLISTLPAFHPARARLNPHTQLQAPCQPRGGARRLFGARCSNLVGLCH